MARKQDKKIELTEQDVETAITHAKGRLNARIEYDEKYQPKGFSKWGNDKCISRTAEAIEEMENGTASPKRVGYWKDRW